MKKRIVFVLNNLQYADGVAKVLVELCNFLDEKLLILRLFQFIDVIQTLLNF